MVYISFQLSFKLVIVIAGFKLFLLRNAFVTKHYVTEFPSE